MLPRFCKRTLLHRACAETFTVDRLKKHEHNRRTIAAFFGSKPQLKQTFRRWQLAAEAFKTQGELDR
jgi:hypothetical protein